MTPITSSSPAFNFPSLGATSAAPAANGTSFADMLMQALHQTSAADGRAQSMVAQGLAGGDVTMAELVVATREADLSFNLMMQVRNKMLEAYNEIKQMQF